MRRKIIAFGTYYHDFMNTLSEKESRKVKYILVLLEREDRLPVKFIKHIKEHGNLYELRMKFESNIYRLFFIFDNDRVVVLFHGFQKKTQKTPQGEIEKALRIREEYYEYKKIQDY
ncbi:Phage-related protein [Prevotellaceae bacterium HUN156]|nr:Phage-related protein [Prevotellaceae bacterium HUN156]